MAERDTAIVYAGVRDLSKALELKKIAENSNGKVRVVKLDAGIEESNKEFAKVIADEQGKVDVVIANAAIGNQLGPVESVPEVSMTEHFQVNTLGPLFLFQSLLPLLKKSPVPKFIAVSTVGGSIAVASKNPFKLNPYGASKAALNYISVRIHAEYPDIISFPIHPGTVSTDTVGEFLISREIIFVILYPLLISI